MHIIITIIVELSYRLTFVIRNQKLIIYQINRGHKDLCFEYYTFNSCVLALALNFDKRYTFLTGFEFNLKKIVKILE